MTNRDAETLASLDTIITLLAQQSERIARIEGMLAGQPLAADFHALRGRVEEISRHLPALITPR